MSASPPPTPRALDRKDSVSPQESYGWDSQSQPALNKMVLETSTDSLMGETPRTLRHSKPKDESLFEMIRLGIVNHQMGLSINCLLLLALTYLFFPSLRSNTSRYFVLSYKDDQTGLYKAGFDDLYFVVLWIVVFTGLRAATMDYVLMPWARNMGIKKKKHTLRFAEQSWMIIYYSVTWPAGIYLYVTSSYYGNLPAMWADYPNVHMAPLMKLYYLIQFAFWIQQIVVVHIEERRKDHWQMFSHHIITCILMFASYGSYQTKVGHVILVVMDVVDIVLPLAKNLKYAGYPIACDIMFGVFILTWFVTRHIFFPMICWSVYRDIPVVMPGGCYDPSTRMKDSTNGGNEIWRNIVHAYKGGEGPVCFNEVLRLSYLGLLLTLQLLITVWFTMICRVAYGVLSGKGAEDSRSDDEDEGDEEEEEPQPSPVRLGKRPAQTRTGSGRLPKEEEVGVEQLRFVKRTSPPARRTKARASGISIPGHTDHKELLGRIGCDKPSGS